MKSAAQRPAPYPSDLRAKGWRFELDQERIAQSDTWALASPFMRPWLLMTWMVAWQQTPCGSLPNCDELIAARIGMEVDQFVSNRKILLRGWWLADDGRMYHDVIAEQVIGMLENKRTERERKAAYRDRMAALEAAKKAEEQTNLSKGVPRQSRGTSTGVPRQSRGCDATGTGTGTVLNTYGAQTAPDRRPDCPHQAIIDLYHETLLTAPKVKRWTETRARLLRARWNEDPKRQDLGWWKRFFEYVGESDFLMGRLPANGRAPFEASLDWLIKSENLVKVIEGRYENRTAEVSA